MLALEPNLLTATPSQSSDATSVPNKTAMVQVLNLIAHRNDSASAIPRRELSKLIYGPDSVFARSPTAAQVGSVTTADVAAFLHTWERPDSAVFGLVGKPILRFVRC